MVLFAIALVLAALLVLALKAALDREKDSRAGAFAPRETPAATTEDSQPAKSKPATGQRVEAVTAGTEAASGAGVLEISSRPPGAVVFLNGVKRGATPTRLAQLPLGRELEVRLEAEGFRPWSQRVSLEADSPRRSLEAGLYPLVECPNGAGWLYVSTEPKGAVLELDGRRFPGATPMIIDNLCAGNHHSIRLHAAGYKPWTNESVSVSAGEVTNLDVVLER